MASKTHEYLVKGWLFAREAIHGKNRLVSDDGAKCGYAMYLAGNGINIEGESREYYPPYRGQLAKFNAGAKILESVVPSGNIAHFNDCDWTSRDHIVAVFRLAIKKCEEMEGISPSALDIYELNEAELHDKIQADAYKLFHEQYNNYLSENGIVKD